MDLDIEALAWPAQRLGEGLEELARRAGLQPAAGAALVMPPAVQAGAAPDRTRWLAWACGHLAIESEEVAASAPELAALLRQAAPAVLLLHTAGGPLWLLLLGRRGTRLRLLGNDLRVHSVPQEAVRAALCERHERPLRHEIDRLLDSAAVPAARRAAVRRALLEERLADKPVASGWLLRQPPGTHFWRQLSRARLAQRVVWMLAAFAAVYALEIAGWRVIGQAALEGRLDTGWLMAWVLLVLGIVPLRLLAAWHGSHFALGAARLLKQRLLAGALNMDLDAARQLGTGQLLARVMESQALESLALDGGLAVLVSLLELAFAAWILAAGVVPGWHLGLLLAWLVLIALLATRYGRVLRGWTVQRLALTEDLVEGIVGHRTRLAQEQPARRDAQEDRALQGYLHTSQALDRAVVPIAAGAPGGWILLGLLGLAPAFSSGQASAAGLAISLGGVLFAHRAFNGLSGGVASLLRAAQAWQQVGPVFKSGASDAAAEAFVGSAQMARGQGPLLDASQLVFGHRGGSAPVLRGVDLRIAHGERILLEGASGSGKTTLAALLSGLRQPDSGLLLLGGLDRHTLGEAWHGLATEAPQFHDNHVLSGTLAFNLLMGRQWPASEADLQEAHALCIELGLGDLIARMPAGLAQRVGETGWQLSHGERSRIFLARALLQRAPLTVLDESFAALDPQTLRRCLDCALRHADALVVIAHP